MPKHCDHSQCLSLSLLFFLRRLTSLNGSVWARIICLVRVTYIRTCTSRVHSLFRSRGTSLSLSTCQVPRIASLVSLVLRLGSRPPSSRFTSPLSSRIHRGSTHLQIYVFVLLLVFVLVLVYFTPMYTRIFVFCTEQNTFDEFCRIRCLFAISYVSVSFGQMSL